MKPLRNSVVILLGYIVGLSHSMVIDQQVAGSRGFIIDPVSDSEVLDPHGYIVDPSSDSGEIAVDPLPTPVGVTFLGVGYNILKGNPEGGDIANGGVDPGLLTTRKIFKLTYDENNMSDGGKYLVPDEAVFTPRESCVSKKNQEVFYGTKSYQEKVGVDVGVSRYEEAQGGIDTYRKVSYEEKTVCNKGQARYQTELAIHDKYPLNGGFVAAACRLRRDYDENSYMSFLEDWGTHIVSQVDVGTKVTDRYEEEQTEFVHYAMKEISISVSAEYGVQSKIRASLFCKQELTSEMKFGHQTHTYTSGSDDMHEPIGLFLLGMHEVFDADYWELINQYVRDGLCSSSWIIDRDTIQANVLSSIQGYAEWKNANPSDDPIVEIPVTWPYGTYGVPQPYPGCPNTHFQWAQGLRFHDTENNMSDNTWSNPCHLAGAEMKDNMYHYFCLKTRDEEDIYKWSWPPGMYCIFQKGACPDGMDPGWVYWDDEDFHNDNYITGELPDGTYNQNTKIEFCCQTSGSASNTIYLPVDDSFFLFKYNHQCQQVHGMNYTEECFRWDTQNRRNNDDHGGAHPYRGHTSNGVVLEYCYYEKE
ncbi:uncharacterized protein [Amphiura filiformis]|uniref:uncharacterized protein n=1 Tax=Amphiura filiformis TaxID=82378 RepID=UPI003B20C61B